MIRTVGSLSQRPARLSFAWYMAAILSGTLLLLHPLSRQPEVAPISLLDALFTATSATCVTGLVVRSTAHDFSMFGQFVILVLMQVGGIGIMTVTTWVTFRFGGGQGLHQRTLLVDTLGTTDEETNLRWVLGRVLRLTLIFEGTGFVLLSARLLYDQPPLTALWHALFHTVSAFCNAGFALRDDSLMIYQDDWLVNLTVMGLILVGGIGFPVILDIARNMHGPWIRRWDRLLLHSKIMLLGTASLLSLGFVAFLFLEWNGVMQDMPLHSRLLAAAFHSTTCRTAGFNTVEVGQLTQAMLFVTILLMLIGAGPCSAAGGFKVSTIFVLALRSWTTFRGHPQVTFGRRSIPLHLVERATATALLFASVVALALTLLLIVEHALASPGCQEPPFLESAFEIVSALCTVGLSTGVTDALSLPGRAIMIVLMFAGRLGPITMFAVLARPPREQVTRYASEEPLIG